MLLEILRHTPTYVFVLFAALLWLGVSQLLTRRIGLRRVMIMGLAMVGFSLYGTLSAFPGLPVTLLSWFLAAAAAFAFVLNRPLPAGTRYDAWQGRFTVPGSAVPLVLIMSIFLTKYVVGVAMATHPQLATSLDVALPISLVYGLFSGTFAARSARLWRLAARTEGDNGGRALSA